MIYITKDYLNVFFVNLKCGYSTFQELCKKGDIIKFHPNYAYRQLNKEILEKMDKNAVKLWIIMRCPYSRICSFYKDKFINCFMPDNTEYRNQPSQTNMYKYYSKERIQNLEFTMSDLLDAIKNGYEDNHFDLQCNMLKYNVFNKKVNIIKFEDENFNDVCKNIIGVEMPKENVTQSNTVKLTDDEKVIIYNMFKPDFELYES